MNLWKKIIDQLQLEHLTNSHYLDRPIRGAFCGDLLSDVLARATPGHLWITIHRHRNTVAVASLVNLSGIIITGNRQPDQDTLAAAEQEDIPLFATPLDNFQAAGKLYKILTDYSIL